jgi:hypothetical protein
MRLRVAVMWGEAMQSLPARVKVDLAVHLEFFALNINGPIMDSLTANELSSALSDPSWTLVKSCSAIAEPNRA